MNLFSNDFQLTCAEMLRHSKSKTVKNFMKSIPPEWNKGTYYHLVRFSPNNCSWKMNCQEEMSKEEVLTSPFRLEQPEQGREFLARIRATMMVKVRDELILNGERDYLAYHQSINNSKIEKLM